MKKFILMVISAIIAFSAAIPYVSAESESDYSTYQNNVELLTALGVISKDIDTSNMNAAAQRAYLIDMAIGLRNIRSMTVSSSGFSDVTDTTKCANSIKIAEAIGIIDKSADGLFHPDSQVKEIEAYKVVLNILGYVPTIVSTANNDEYHKAAATANLSKNIITDSNGCLTMEQLVRLFTNALSAEVMYSFQGNSYATNGTTALEEFSGIYSGTGQISSIYDMNTNDGYIKRTDKIYIDGVEYLFDKNTSVEQYLGYEVKYYYKELDNDELEIIYMSPTKRNFSVTIEYGSIYSYENGELKYDNGREKKARIETDFVILNGVSEVIGKQSFDFNGYDGGYINLVDSDGNGKYDFVNIVKYNNYYVENTNAEKHLIYAQNSNKLSLDIDDYPSETNILICEKYRNIISFDEIKKGDILSVANSTDGLYITVYRSSKKISGTVSSISYDKNNVDNIKIADAVYSVANPSLSFSTGGEYTLYLDFMDTIAYTDHISNANEGLAYLINMYKDEAGDVEFKLYTDEGEFLYAKAASKIKIGKANSTTKCSADDYNKMQNILSPTADVVGNGINQLIRYKKNKESGLTSVIAATNDGSDSEFSLDYAPTAGYVRSGTYVDGRYRINYAATTVFRIPADLKDYSKYSVTSEMDSSVNYQGLKLFNIDKDTNVPEAAMFFVDSQTYKSTAVTYGALGIVANVNEVWDDNEEEFVTSIDFMINGKSNIINYKDGEFLKNANGGNAVNPKELNIGDVLQAYIGSDGKIAACRVIYTRDNKDSGTYKLAEPSSIVDDNTVLYGTVKYSDGEYMILSETNGFEAIGSLSGARVYIYDTAIRSEEDRVSVGSADDLFREQEVVIKKSATGYNQIVVYK